MRFVSSPNCAVIAVVFSTLAAMNAAWAAGPNQNSLPDRARAIADRFAVGDPGPVVLKPARAEAPSGPGTQHSPEPKTPAGPANGRPTRIDLSDQRIADEAEMLERARREAAERAKAEAAGKGPKKAAARQPTASETGQDTRDTSAKIHQERLDRILGKLERRVQDLRNAKEPSPRAKPPAQRTQGPRPDVASRPARSDAAQPKAARTAQPQGEFRKTPIAEKPAPITTPRTARKSRRDDDGLETGDAQARLETRPSEPMPKQEAGPDASMALDESDEAPTWGRRFRLKDPDGDAGGVAGTDAGPRTAAVQRPKSQRSASEILFGPGAVRTENLRVQRREPGGLDVSPRSDRTGRVTVLLQLRVGNRGIRRFQKWADPVLCLGRRCFISNGAELPAREMSRRRAFGTVNTMGRRAGACKRKLACVFRDIPLGAGTAVVQPIDLRWLRHDRRAPIRVFADSSCKVVRGGRLRCARTFVSETYRLWVVPEGTAARLNARAIETALHDGLGARR